MPMAHCARPWPRQRAGVAVATRLCAAARQCAPMGTLYLVRHGQASFGTDDYDLLSELGVRQCERLGEWFREHGACASTA